MALTNAFHEAVNTGDILSVRIMMKNSLLFERSFAEFHEMEKAAASLYGLYDAHDGRELNENPSAWNDDYMDLLMVQVVDNFSHERLEHLQRVVRYLRPYTPAQTLPPKRPGRESSPKLDPKSKPSNSKQENGTKVAVGAVSGAVVGGVATHIAGGAVAVGLVVGGVVGSVVAALVINGDKS